MVRTGAHDKVFESADVGMLSDGRLPIPLGQRPTPNESGSPNILSKGPG
jgi:hypothetical protein